VVMPDEANVVVMPGLDPASIHLRNKIFQGRWITGSSPVMTSCSSATAAGTRKFPQAPSPRGRILSMVSPCFGQT
jgi:hypothetical protein